MNASGPFEFKFRALPFFATLCLLTFLFGGLFRPGEWYTSINIAPWSPPNIAFPIAWTILYMLIALAGSLIQYKNDATLSRLWFIQLALNAAWSWLFFGQHWVLAALIDLVLIDLLVMIIIVGSWKKQIKTVALLMSPYLVWLLLATSLNTYILLNN